MIAVSGTTLDGLRRSATDEPRGGALSFRGFGISAAATVGWAVAAIWAHYGRFPGPHDIAELRERLTGDPELLEVFEESYRIGKAEFGARLRAAG